MEEFHSTMQLNLWAIMITSASLTHIARVSGMKCLSQCGACWKDGSPGVDIKMSCTDYHCGEQMCPEGYSGMHCATKSRCQ